MLCAAGCYCWFLIKGKTLIVDSDGWRQHFAAFVYLGQYGREVARTLLTTHKLVLPHWDFSIGLGSDVAGGHTLDLFTVMATAVQVSKLRWRYIDQSEKPLTMVEALYMATVGGGDFWADFGEKVGLFEDGYAFDALVLDDDPLKNMRAFSAAERLERYAYLGKGKLTAKFAAGEKLL